MKKLVWFGLVLAVFAPAGPSKAQDNTAQHTITLYSPLQYGHDFGRQSVDLQRADYAPRLRFGDVGYGSLRVGAEFDWLEISGAQNNRSVILDLGKYDWSDKFTVPWIEPLAKLKPGEHREVFVSSTGKDGKDGKPGFGAGNGDGLSPLPSGGSGTNPSACCDSSSSTGTIDRGYPTEPSRRPKRPAGVQTSANLLRAVLDHIYVIHVVDDRRDFYALFRVESLQRGDNCTISWKMIPPPPQQTAVSK